MPQALIIEDEATARADLRAKLALHPEVTILAEAATIRSARVLLARPDYDLVFLDIPSVSGIHVRPTREILAPGGAIDGGAICRGRRL